MRKIKFKVFVACLLAIVTAEARVPVSASRTDAVSTKVITTESNSPKTYIINSTDDFSEFLSSMDDGHTYDHDTVLLTQDFDFPNTTNNKQRIFKGTLKGNGHKISGVNRCLFLRNEGIISNLNLSSGSISGTGDIAAFCIKNYGSIISCTSLVNISGYSNEYMHVGGICSYNYGHIIDSKNAGNVTCTLSQEGWSTAVTRCGGITAYSEGDGIIYCTNTGLIKHYGVYSSITGGITGDLQHGKIIGCINKGEVYGYLKSAGLSTSVSASYKLQYTGGIAGHAQVNSYINRCLNYGHISSNFQYVGGIAGKVSETDIYNVVNYGKVESFEGVGYSCAAGITGYSRGVNSYTYFYNCINHGEILSIAKYDIATAAGIAMELNKCYIANCYSDGSVSAQRTGGTATQAFTISQYEAEDSDIKNNPTSIEEANEFIFGSPQTETTLLKWYMNNEKIGLEEKFISYPLARHGDCDLFIFSDKENNFLKTEITNSETGKSSVYTTSNSPIRLSHLYPTTSYTYEIQDIENQFVETGNFKTLTPQFSFSIKQTGYEDMQVSYNYEAMGIELFEAQLSIENTSNHEKEIRFLTDTVSFVNELIEDTPYSLQIIYNLNGKSFSSQILNANTLAITPKFKLLEKTPYSIKMLCENLQELIQYKPRIFLDTHFSYTPGSPVKMESRSIFPDKDGIITIDNLQYDNVVPIQSEYSFNDETRHREIEQPTTSRWGGEGIIQISNHAAMIHGLFGGLGEKIPDDRYYNNWSYDIPYFYYRDALADVSVVETLIDCARIDNRFDYATTIPLESEIAQFYIGMRSNKKYYGQYPYKNGEWQAVNGNFPNVAIVEPRFYAVELDGTEVSFSFIDGEETTSNVYIEYGIEGTSALHRIDLGGKGSRRISKSFSTFVASLPYIMRFCSETIDGKIYYSNYFRILNNTIEEIFPTTDIKNIENDGVKYSVSDNTVSIYNCYSLSCKIYNTQGLLVAQQINMKDAESFSLKPGNIYIIKLSNGIVYKVRI